MIADLVSYETIAITMFATMLLMLLTGQRVFGAIGFVAAMAALLLWGDGAVEMPYTAAWKLFKWYPMLTLPLFIYMGYMISESGIADDLYKMFHVYFGGITMGVSDGFIKTIFNDETASSTRTPSGITSLPIPSPGIKAILRFFFIINFLS